MSDAYLNAIFGLLGVFLGTALTPILSSRVSARANARLAARLARCGLEEWIKALEIARRAPSRLKAGQVYGIQLALELKGFGERLNLRWWEDNRVALLARSTDNDMQVLQAGFDGCWYVTQQIDRIGDAGWEANEKLAKARRSRRNRPEGAAPPVAGASMSISESDSLAASPDDLASPHSDLDPEISAILEEITALLDYRLTSAEESWKEFLSISDRLDAAVATCRRIEKSNNGPFGVVASMRRRRGP